MKGFVVYQLKLIRVYQRLIQFNKPLPHNETFPVSTTRASVILTHSGLDPQKIVEKHLAWAKCQRVGVSSIGPSSQWHLSKVTFLI